MKHPELIVKIPEPCHEDWNKMSPTEKGRFCKVCTKEVVDFTAKSDEEIINHFSNHGNLCGRFQTTQLNRKLIADRKKRNHWLSYAATLLLPMTVFSQGKPKMTEKVTKTEQLDTYNFTRLHIGSLDRKAKKKIQKDTLSITGIILDETKIPFPGATIQINGTNTKTSTDFDGNFSLQVTVGDILLVSYVGCESQEVKILADKTVYKVILKPGEPLEEVIVVAGQAVKLSGVAGAAIAIDGDKLTTNQEKKKSIITSLKESLKKIKPKKASKNKKE
ncbi:carboxypeptidase-like regulatory domain-containing protein [uncultured Kordia sp.]|uniref:carboxypeptidase-like regulatory domain-containing protein n=1 Tax=uncultured Kordia sp. TaxID=507699 RepID=UPI002635AB3B|nr:carboxypeptidase-like regulatory domain-containing protein [uncultured Kordia sp.]